MSSLEEEIWFLSLFGVDFTEFKKSQLVAVRFGFTAFFPFFILILVSLLTRPNEKKHLDYFYGKLYTPVKADPKEDLAAVSYTAEHPESISHRKLFPNSQFEIAKPTKMDLVGFFGSWGIVAVIIFLLWGMVSIR